MIKIYDKMYEILPSAVKFYGTNYSKIINNVVDNVRIFTYNDYNKESYIKELNIKDTLECAGVYFYNKGPIVLIKEDNKNNMLSALIHELYGHAILGNKNFLQVDGNHIYVRNGLFKGEYGKSTNQKNRMLNEGMVEYIRTKIEKDFKGKSGFVSSCYFDAYNVATYLFNRIGTERMIDILVNGSENIEDIIPAIKEVSKALDNHEDMSSYILELTRS